MRLITITELVSEIIGRQYTPIIDNAIANLESDRSMRFNVSQIRFLACKAQSIYDHYRIEVFEGNTNPYTLEERQDIIKYYLDGQDVSLYVAIFESTG